MDNISISILAMGVACKHKIFAEILLTFSIRYDNINTQYDTPKWHNFKISVYQCCKSK